ncbi:MAG: lysostaphin resistance A-like protein [bacterium]
MPKTISKLSYIIFVASLFLLYFLNVFSDKEDFLHQNEKITNYNYDVSKIALDKYSLLRFYKEINIEKVFDWDREKKKFSYFLIFALLIVIFSGFLISLGNKFDKKGFYFDDFLWENFFLAFFLYYFLQIFLQMLGVNVLFPAIKSLLQRNLFYEGLVLELLVFKFLVIFFSLFLSPLMWMILLRFNFYKFFQGFILVFLREVSVFLKILLLVIFAFILSLLFFSKTSGQVNLLILYVMYGGFWELVIFFLGVVLLVPLVEELIFRRILIENLLNLFGKLWSVVFSAIIFALIHFESPLNSLVIFFIGLILGFIYILKRSIVYTYFFHSIYNFLVLVYWVYFGRM